MTLDELLRGDAARGYRLARRHDPSERSGSSLLPLLDELGVGLRVFLARLPPRAEGRPDERHKGVEAVTVAQALCRSSSAIAVRRCEPARRSSPRPAPSPPGATSARARRCSSGSCAIRAEPIRLTSTPLQGSPRRAARALLGQRLGPAGARGLASRACSAALRDRSAARRLAEPIVLRRAASSARCPRRRLAPAPPEPGARRRWSATRARAVPCATRAASCARSPAPCARAPSPTPNSAALPPPRPAPRRVQLAALPGADAEALRREAGRLRFLRARSSPPMGDEPSAPAPGSAERDAPAVARRTGRRRSCAPGRVHPPRRDAERVLSGDRAPRGRPARSPYGVGRRDLEVLVLPPLAAQ